MTKEEKRTLKKIELYNLDENKISEETIIQLKSLDKVKWELYCELVKTKQIDSVYKFKGRKRIFYNKEEDKFFYFNPIFKKLFYCGKFVD